VLGASVFQLNVLVSRFLASFKGDGAVSNLYYADRLIEFPLGVFVFAIGTASLPAFSRLVKSGQRPALREAFSGSLALALALALPSALGLILLREPIFATLFAWNPSLFGEAAVRGCALALCFYALGLVPITVSRTYVNLCMAHEDTRTPAQAAVVSLVANVLFSLALIGPLPSGPLPEWIVAFQNAWVVADLGYPGLALSSSLASLANALYLILVSHRRHGGMLARSDGVRWLRLGAAGVALVAALWGLGGLVPLPRAASAYGLALLTLNVVSGALVYLLALWLGRSPELHTLLAVLRRSSRLPQGAPDPE
jgi:putative peptidoglycan lipid II flippase